MSERLEPHKDLSDCIASSPDLTTNDYAVESGLAALGGLKAVIERTRLHSSDQEAIELWGKKMTEAGLTEAEQRIVMIMAT